MTNQMNRVNFRWELNNIILPPQTWVYSEPFSSLKDVDVNFDIGLQMNCHLKNLKIRVRKSDSRSAKAVVKIDLLKKTAHEQRVFLSPFGNNMGSIISQRDSNNKLLTFRVCKDMAEENTLFNWKELCTFDKFSNFSCENEYGILFSSMECCIKDTIVRCSILWLGFKDPEPITVVPEPVFQPIFQPDVFSDIVIVIEDSKLPAHRIILSAHSPYFNTMFTTDVTENKKNRIEIKDFTIDIITEMLDYFYTNKTKASRDVNVALKMIPVANKYQISSLKNICKATLSRNINLDNVFTILYAAADYDISDLHKKTINFMVENKESIVIIPEFENLCLTKPQILYEFIRAIVIL